MATRTRISTIHGGSRDDDKVRAINWSITNYPVIHTNVTSVGNVGAGEDTLMTYTVQQDAMAFPGDFIEVHAWGTFGATANNKTVKMYFGSTVVMNSGAQAQNGGSWSIRAKIMATSSTAQTAIAELITNSALFTDDSSHTTPAETISGTIVIKCTGTGTADNDIVQKGVVISRYMS